MKRNHSKRNGHNRKKASALLTSLIVLLCVSVVSTVAYLIATDKPIMNIFKPTSVSCEVVESFVDDVKTNVSIKNTGETYAYIRAAIVVTWKDAEGNIYAGLPKENTDYMIDLNLAGWFKNDKDGFYYCKTPVAPGGDKAVVPDHATPVLINECKPLVSAPAGYGLNVEILASAIQSDPANAVEVWGITADEISKGGAGE